MSDTESVRAAFVDLWASMGPFWGVPPATARVYGWLLSKKDAATADAIVEGTGMSRGAVSMAVRELRDWRLVHLESAEGTRQQVYRPETDLERAIRSIVEVRKRREWDPILDHLRVWIPRLEAEKSQEAAVFRKRLGEIAALVATADSMAESFLGGGLVNRLGLKFLVAAAGRKGSGKKSSTRRKP
jgi:DNA-binding transcriptional regulator GbsR (MarR family)